MLPVLKYSFLATIKGLGNMTEPIGASGSSTVSAPSEEALIKALEMEWHDHFQTRAQTWRILEVEGALVAGIIGADWAFGSVLATLLMIVPLTILVALGISVSRHHHRIQIMKFEHITNIEKYLHLLGPDLIKNYDFSGSQRTKMFRFFACTHLSLLAFGIAIATNRVWETVN